MIEVFKLSESVEIKEIGYEFPQVEEDWGNMDYWGKSSVISTPLSGIINFKVIFPKFLLRKHAKLTDMLSANNASRYLMVDEKLFRLLSEFSLDDFQYFIEKVHAPQGAIDYYLIYLTTPREDEFFDWSKCLFYDFHDPERKLFAVKDAKSYYAAANGKVLKPERLVVLKNQPKYDLFRFLYLSGSWFYVSGRLKSAMEAARITGVRYHVMQCYEPGEI